MIKPHFEGNHPHGLTAYVIAQFNGDHASSECIIQRQLRKRIISSEPRKSPYDPYKWELISLDALANIM